MHIYATFSFFRFNQALKSYMKKQYKEEFLLKLYIKNTQYHKYVYRYNI